VASAIPGGAPMTTTRSTAVATARLAFTEAERLARLRSPAPRHIRAPRSRQWRIDGVIFQRTPLFGVCEGPWLTCRESAFFLPPAIPVSRNVVPAGPLPASAGRILLPRSGSPRSCRVLGPEPAPAKAHWGKGWPGTRRPDARPYTANTERRFSGLSACHIRRPMQIPQAAQRSLVATAAGVSA
jgi:hypothetical protein